MKKFLTRALALSLALTIAFSLTGCGPKKDDGQGGGEVTASPAPTDELDALGVEFLPDNETDVAQQILGFSGDTTLLTVNGTAVTAEEYLYWLGNMTAYYEMMMMYSGTGESLDLTAEVSEGVTWDQQLKEVAYQNCLLLAVTPEAAAQYGVTLDDAAKADVVSQREHNMENAGGEEQYAYQLQAMGISDRSAFRLDMVSALFTELEEAYTAKALGDGDEAITDEEMAAYLEENGLLRAKHILLLTKDMNTGEAYDDATKAQQRAKAEDILSQLRADPSKFDTLMNENSEDTGLSSYPDGYLFGPGEMVSAFEEGTRALEVGDISDIVESDYGYHIILRLDADCDESRSECAKDKFNEMMNGYVENAVVEKSAEYDSFTTQEYYSALLEFQESLEAPTVVDDMSDATLEPQPTEGTDEPEESAAPSDGE